MEEYLKGVKPLIRHHTIVPHKNKCNIVVQNPQNTDLLKANFNLISKRSNLSDIGRKEKRKFQIERTIDLHGYTKEQAFLALIKFFNSCQQANIRKVLVITGGNNMRNSTLRQAFQLWVKENFGHYITSCTNANLWHGGEGAFYVVLKH